MNVGLKYTDLGVACLLERTQVIFTVIIAAIFLKESMTRLSILLTLIGIAASTALMPVDYSVITMLSWEASLGALCLVGAGFVWAISSVMGRKLAKDQRALDMALVRGIVGILTALPLALLFEIDTLLHALSWRILLLASCGGILATGIAYSLYYYGLQILPVGIAGMLETFTPITAMILGIAFLNEQMSAVQWIAAIILLSALTALVWVEARQHHADAAQPQE